jgi:hypothetical protein
LLRSKTKRSEIQVYFFAFFCYFSLFFDFFFAFFRFKFFASLRFNLERAEMAARSNWIADPVRPSAHSYAKMFLNLLEAIAPTGTVAKHEPEAEAQ